ncbi:MAG: RagB/SusD family nutrient uptake outer membrane protein [Ferruginibacter sp.]
MFQYKNSIGVAAMVAVFLFLGVGCKKYLDEKPNKQLVIPSTLVDLQALLQFEPAIFYDPGSDEVSADNYYLEDADYFGYLPDGDRRMYTWQKDGLFQSYPNEWSQLYKRIYYTNTVLDALPGVQRTSGNAATYDDVKGQALLLRGKSFLQAAIIWSPVYDKDKAGSTLGIPLRLNADFNEVTKRATLKETFDVVLSDLTLSAALLPVTPVHVTRPSRPAAFGYLARAYLYMGEYELAGKYADSCLQLQSSLMDYNALDATAAYPVPRFNEEEIMYNASASIPLIYGIANIDSLLYQSFTPDDLRKEIFFQDHGNGTFIFKGSYDGNFGGMYTGVATDEMYLTRAECFARSGNKQAALDDLNTLLIKRWRTGSFIPFTAGDAAGALALTLTERRKELMFRSLRFADIKRLNRDGAGIVLKRITDGVSYTLAPNDARYALAIPEEVITISGIEQNPR